MGGTRSGFPSIRPASGKPSGGVVFQRWIKLEKVGRYMSDKDGIVGWLTEWSGEQDNGIRRAMRKLEDWLKEMNALVQEEEESGLPIEHTDIFDLIHTIGVVTEEINRSAFWWEQRFPVDPLLWL